MIARLSRLAALATLLIAAAGCQSAPASTAARTAVAAAPEAPSSPDPSTATTSSARGAVGFASEARLAQHFQKHGAEFPGLSQADYLRAAQDLRDAPVSANVIERVRQDHVVTRFDRASKAFIAFDPDGTIRTFFKPTDGEAYFNRQARRR